MKNTSLCYIMRDDQILLIHKTGKRDLNFGKWIGVGGKFEEGESPRDCAAREIKEETGLSALSLRYRGIVTFVSDIYETEQMHLFDCKSFTGELKSSDEGEVVFVGRERLYSLPSWEGDKIFLDLLFAEAPFFDLKLIYKGERLVSHTLNFD